MITGGKGPFKLSFDQEIDRSGTGSVKWGMITDPSSPEDWIKTDAYFGKDRILPMWVADMDFASPEPVVEALLERARHPVFGYTMLDEPYIEAVTGWMRRHHGWEVASEWIVNTPGVVPALHMLVSAFTRPGEKVLVQRPVYYPFFSAIMENQRVVVSNSLVLQNKGYQMDYADLARKAADPKVTLAILCSPHNPVGRVWEREELRRFGNICRQNGVLVIADEIHGDLILKGNRFTPYAMIGDELTQNCVICTSPSKTFNLAGLQTANLIIPNPLLRNAFKKEMQKNGILGINPFGKAACQAAYTHGDPWLSHLLDYLQNNVAYLMEQFKDHIPHIPVIKPEGTYLIWFDCRALDLDPMALRDLMLGSAKVFLDEGYIFGPEGKGFERMNIACPRSLLVEAVERIIEAVKEKS